MENHVTNLAEKRKYFVRLNEESHAGEVSGR
jgi:hypothetical protein